MAVRRNTNSERRFWMVLCGLVIFSLMVGYVMGGTLAGGVLPRLPFLYHVDSSVNPTAGTQSAPASKDHNTKLATMSRDNLESEVSQLRQDLDAKNRELDDLKIQVKLLSKGSRTK